MIQSVQIQNFKSVVDLTLELGTFNVLIGANGCGKSNILEAIAFGAAASADKLDHEFLGSRGIRMTNPEFMFSAFAGNKRKSKIIDVFFFNNKKFFPYKLKINPINKRGWIEDFKNTMKRFDAKGRVKNLQEQLAELDGNKIIDSIKDVHESFKSKKDITKTIKEIEELHNEGKKLLAGNRAISTYILYSPEQTSLRKFEDTNQI